RGADGGEIGAADLDDGAKFLGEELGEDGGTGVSDPGYNGRQGQIDTDMPGESHFDDGGKQTAVRAVVVGEEFLLAAELLDGVPEIFQIGGAVHVGRGFTHLRDGLRKD